MAWKKIKIDMASSCFLSNVLIDGFHHFLNFRITFIPGDRCGEAGAHMLLHNEEGGFFEGSPCGIDLGHDVDTVFPVINHLGDATDLSFDPLEAIQRLFFCFVIDHNIPPWGMGGNTPQGVCRSTSFFVN